MTDRTAPRRRPKRSELWRASLWLGVIGFGGGLSVMSSIRRLAVEQRGWLTEREFANTAAVSQMLPGGAAANALAYLGLRFGGASGALAAYAGFILPGWLSVVALAWAYVRFGATPDVETVLGGFNAAVVGIIAAVTLKMVRASIGRLWQMGVAAGALALSLAGGAPPGEIALIGAIAGLTVDLGTKRWRLGQLRGVARQDRGKLALPEEGPPLQPEGAPPAASAVPGAPADPSAGEGGSARAPAWTALLALALASGAAADLIRLGLIFFRTGLGAYGGGFAIVPHLQQVMQQTGWLTDRQFADAVAIGKLTPGPVLLLAAFIGYLRHGLAGSAVATVAIFAAPFALLVVAGTWLDRMRSRRGVRAALRGLTPSVLGLMAAAALSLGTSLDGRAEVAIAAMVALTLTRFELNPALLLVVGGVARVVLRLAGI